MELFVRDEDGLMTPWNGEVGIGASAAIGAVDETAPAGDTADSGLNGRLQRIAQRLTSLIALVPASLGQKTKAASLAVTWASDQDVPAKGQTTRALDYTNGQKVTVTSTSAQSSAITATEVRLYATKAMFVYSAAEPTATAAGNAGFPMAAGQTEYIQITSGHKIAAIRDTEDGALFITPVA